MVAVSPGTTKDTVVVAGMSPKPRNGKTDGKQWVVDCSPVRRRDEEGRMESRQDDTSTKTDDTPKGVVIEVVEREEVETTTTVLLSSGADAEENTTQATEEREDNTANENGGEEIMAEVSTTEHRTARMIEAATSIVASLTTREEEPTIFVTTSSMEEDNADEDDTAAAAADPDFWAATVATVIAVAAATAIMKATDTACCQGETTLCPTAEGGRMLLLSDVRTTDNEDEDEAAATVPWNNRQQPQQYAAMADEIEETRDDTADDDDNHDNIVVVSTSSSQPQPSLLQEDTTITTTTTTTTTTTQKISTDTKAGEEKEVEEVQHKEKDTTNERLCMGTSIAQSVLEQFEAITMCGGGGGAPAPVRETVHASCCADPRLVLHGRATKDTITPYPTPILTVPKTNIKENENNTEEQATTSCKENEEVLDTTPIPNISNTTTITDSTEEADRTINEPQPRPHIVSVATRQVKKHQPEEPNHPKDDTIQTQQMCDPTGSVVVPEPPQEHWVHSMAAMLDTATTAVTLCSTNTTTFCSGQVTSCTELAMTCTDQTPSAGVQIVLQEPVLNRMASDEVTVPKAAQDVALAADKTVPMTFNNTISNPDDALHNANDSTVDNDKKKGSIKTKVNPSNKRSVDSSIMSESTAITLLIHYFTTLDRHLVTEGEPAKTAVIMFQGLIMPVINGRTPTTSEEDAIRTAAHDANVPPGFVDTFLDHVREMHQNGAMHKGLRPELVSKGRDDNDEDDDDSPVKVLSSINIEPEKPPSSSLSSTLSTPQDVKETTVIHTDSLICETGAVEHDQKYDQDRADKDDKLKLSLSRDDNIDNVLLKGWEPIEDTNQDDGIAAFLQKIAVNDKIDDNKLAAISSTIADDERLDIELPTDAVSSTKSDDKTVDKESPAATVSSTKSDDNKVNNEAIAVIPSSKSNDDAHVLMAAIPRQEEKEEEIDGDDNKEEINNGDNLTAQASRDDKIDDLLLKGWEPIEDTNQDDGIAAFLLQKTINETPAAANASIKSNDEDHTSAAVALPRQEETEKETDGVDKEEINNVDDDHVSALAAIPKQVEQEKENDGDNKKDEDNNAVHKLSASWSRDDDIDNALLKGWEPIENTNQDDDIAALLQKMDNTKARTAAIPFTKCDDDELASLAVEKTHQLVTEIEIDGDHKEDGTNDTDTNVDKEAPTPILSTKCDDDDHAPAVTVISRQAEIKKESDGGHNKEETNEVNNDLTSSSSRHGTIDAVLLKGWEPIEETNQDDNIAVFLQKMGHRPIHEAKRRDIAEIKDLIVRFGHGKKQREVY